MTDKTEAQPEALYVAEQLDATRHAFGDDNAQSKRRASAELRRLHAEIQQLKVQPSEHKAARMAYASEFPPDADGEADVGNLHANIRTLKAQLVAQTNRAAAAEQQVTALTQRLDTANRLNTDARNQLAQLSARQAAPDGWRLVPTEPTSQMLHVGRYGGDKDTPAYGKKPIEGETAWPYVADHTAAKIYRAMLSAAPPPPEREPKCWCETCRPNTLSDMRFIVCPDCGNKRCPKATHHDNACTNSNAPGQPGSSWEHVKPHGATND